MNEDKSRNEKYPKNKYKPNLFPIFTDTEVSFKINSSYLEGHHFLALLGVSFKIVVFYLEGQVSSYVRQQDKYNITDTRYIYKAHWAKIGGHMDIKICHFVSFWAREMLFTSK